MIIERYITNDEEERIYTRYRDVDGSLVEEHHDFRPYFYVLDDERLHQRLAQLFDARFFIHN